MAGDLEAALRELRPQRKESTLTATVSVGTSRSEILPANPNRTQATLVNFTSNLVTISTDPAVTTSDGVPIPPDRGVVILRERDEGREIVGPWYAIANAAATSIGRVGYERMTPRRVA